MKYLNEKIAAFCCEYTTRARAEQLDNLPAHRFRINERAGETPLATFTRVREITDVVGATVHICYDEIWVAAKDAETLSAVRLSL